MDLRIINNFNLKVKDHLKLSLKIKVQILVSCIKKALDVN